MIVKLIFNNCYKMYINKVHRFIVVELLVLVIRLFLFFVQEPNILFMSYKNM